MPSAIASERFLCREVRSARGANSFGRDGEVGFEIGGVGEADDAAAPAADAEVVFV